MGTYQSTFSASAVLPVFFLIFDRKLLITRCCITSILHLHSFVSVYVYLCICLSVFILVCFFYRNLALGQEECSEVCGASSA